jgi:hypothetical protein
VIEFPARAESPTKQDRWLGQHSKPLAFNMAKTVRQRQFRICDTADAERSLVTENIHTCMAFAGVHEEKGIAFLCHLNTVKCANSLPELVDELRKRVDSEDLSGFKLYTVAGVHPFLGWACLAAAVVLALEPPHHVLAAFVALLIGVFWSSTRLMFWWRLRDLKTAFPQKRKALWPLAGLFFFFRSGVAVTADPPGISKVRVYLWPKPGRGNGPLKGAGWRMTNGEHEDEK